MNLTQWECAPQALRAPFDPEQLPFQDTSELAPLDTVIGQQRAVRAMDFGLNIHDRGYNIFVLGVPGTGKSTIAQAMIRKVAEAQPRPDDWCYLHNFSDPSRPQALRLPAGQGRELQRDMERLIAQLRAALPKVFQSKDYDDEHRQIEDGFGKAHQALTTQLEELAQRLSYLIRDTPMGMIVLPIHNGKPLSEEQLEALAPERRAEIQRHGEELHGHIHSYHQNVRLLREETEHRIDDLNRRAAGHASANAVERLKQRYGAVARLGEYIQSVQEDILEHVKDFLPDREGVPRIVGLELEPEQKGMTRYAVNVVVDNASAHGAPVIEETNPTYINLIGRIERRGHLGTFYTDFTLIKAGSVLQANGGYLLLDALDVLRSPFAWDALKRVLKNQEVKIEDLAEQYGVTAGGGLKAEPIPVQLRVVLLGSPLIYYLLQAYDDDFGKIFKVKVDFDTAAPSTDAAPLAYARFVARHCRDEGLPHFDRAAVAAVLEQARRWADDQRKLSLRFSDLADLVHEAAHWARADGRERVAAEHVPRAVAEKVQRSNLLEDRIQELIAAGTLKVDVTGAVVGQVNGLSIYDLGDYRFGRPTRITAQVFLGRSGVVDLEREAKLSGPTHSKGVLILSGFLGGRYAQNMPLALSASLCFEQSYGEVEGDSASAAELIALLSGLAAVPIQQGIALTGAVDQRGELQAIGGVNEKIEGFFAVCNAFGLTGEQGVVIPRANQKHLMLNDAVVGAVAAGRFHIWAVDRVDDAVTILTGVPAGSAGPDGTFPPGSVNALVQQRLIAMAERLRALEPGAGIVFEQSDMEAEPAEDSAPVVARRARPV